MRRHYALEEVTNERMDGYPNRCGKLGKTMWEIAFIISRSLNLAEPAKH